MRKHRRMYQSLHRCGPCLENEAHPSVRTGAPWLHPGCLGSLRTTHRGSVPENRQSLNSPDLKGRDLQAGRGLACLPRVSMPRRWRPGVPGRCEGGAVFTIVPPAADGGGTKHHADITQRACRSGARPCCRSCAKRPRRIRATPPACKPLRAGASHFACDLPQSRSPRQHWRRSADMVPASQRNPAGEQSCQ